MIKQKKYAKGDAAVGFVEQRGDANSILTFLLARGRNIENSCMYRLIKQRISKGDLLDEIVVAEFETKELAEDYYLQKIKGNDPEEGFRWSDWNEYKIIEGEK